MTKYHIAISVITLLLASRLSCSPFTMLKKFSSGRPVDGMIESIIPFDLVGHAIHVKVKVNGSAKEYDFVLDTGAITMMDDRVARELQIEMGAEMPTPDKTKKAYLTREKVVISVGDAGVEDFTIAVFDIEAALNSDLAIDGFIGSDFLRFFRTTIDYQERVLTLSLGGTATEPSRDAYTVKMSKPFPMRFPTVTCRVNGREARAIVDTGCRRGLVVPLSKLDELTEEDATLLRSKGEIAKWPFTEAEHSYLGRVRKLEMGPFAAENVLALFAELPSNGSNLLLGEEFLSEFLVTIDYPEDRLILTPTSELGIADNLFSTGLSLASGEDGGVSVDGFWEGSPADRAGIQLGDEILEFNSKKAEEIDFTEMTEMLRDAKVEAVHLLLRRDDTELECSLKKEMLLPSIEDEE